MRKLTLPLLVLVAHPAYAESKRQPLDTGLTSALVVSPAQMHQVRGRDLGIGFIATSEATRDQTIFDDAGEGEVLSTRATSLEATSVVALEDRWLRFGLSGGERREVVEAKTTSTRVEQDVARSYVAPALGIVVGPVAAGARVKIAEAEIGTTGSDERTRTSATRSDFGLLAALPIVEFGATYAPSYDATAAVLVAAPEGTLVTTSDERQAARWGLHGRVAIADMIVGLSYGRILNGALPRTQERISGSEGARRKDAHETTASVELSPTPELRVESTLTYRTASHTDAASATPDTLAGAAATLGAEYTLGTVLRLGARLEGAHAAATGSTELGDTELSHDVIAVALTGGVKL